MAAAGRIGVGELVDQHERGPARDDGVEVHLVERSGPCSRPALRGTTSKPSTSACGLRRPWVSTTPITTSTPSARRARPDISIS
jgi:hypothetical protein